MYQGGQDILFPHVIFTVASSTQNLYSNIFTYETIPLLKLYSTHSFADIHIAHSTLVYLSFAPPVRRSKIPMIKIKTKTFFSSEVKSILDKYAITSDLLAMFLESTLEDFFFPLFSLLALPDPLPPFELLSLGLSLGRGEIEGVLISLGVCEGWDDGCADKLGLVEGWDEGAADKLGAMVGKDDGSALVDGIADGRDEGSVLKVGESDGYC